MTAAVMEQIRTEYGAVQAALPASVIEPARRDEAIARLGAQGLPSTREENWRYTNLRVLEHVRFAPVATHGQPMPSLPEVPPGFVRYTFVDGLLTSGAPTSDSDLTVRSLRTSGPSHGAAWGLCSESPEARLALLNEAFATDALSIVAHANAAPAGIELLFVATASAEVGASYPRVRVVLETGAKLTVLERHMGAPEAASLVNSAVRVDVGENACLTHYRLQQCAARAAWFDTLAAQLSAHARYHLLTVGTGALTARSTVHVRLAGAGAELALSAAALADRQQSQDMYALSEHVAPNTRTIETFRGIASGRARVAFNGKIAVRHRARGSDSQQSLRGLLDGPQAEIDLRPQLEIYTDEVRCSHGATAGKLDENMLFYLLSRGIAPPTAHHLLKWAFLEDVVAKIERSELRRQIERDLADQMSGSVDLKELL
jgi:Fe-S cluster assembly protein SufD